MLLGRRNPGARFMPGAWVFPGGAADDGDGGLRVTALRELVEEAGLELAGPEVLVPWSRWITPRHLPIRFDTHFFVAPAPAGADARADGDELVDMGWLAAAAASLRMPAAGSSSCSRRSSTSGARRASRRSPPSSRPPATA